MRGVSINLSTLNLAFGGFSQNVGLRGIEVGIGDCGIFVFAFSLLLLLLLLLL